MCFLTFRCGPAGYSDAKKARRKWGRKRERKRGTNWERKKTRFNDRDRASLAVRVIALFCLSQLAASGGLLLLLLLLFLNTCQAAIILQHWSSLTLSSWLIIHKHTATICNHKKRLHIHQTPTRTSNTNRKIQPLRVKFLRVTSPLSLNIPFIFPFNMALSGRGPVSFKDGQMFLKCSLYPKNHLSGTWSQIRGDNEIGWFCCEWDWDLRISQVK